MCAFVQEEIIRGSSLVLVAEQFGRIVGFLVAWLVADEVQLLDIGVHSRARREGCGLALLTSMVKCLRCAVLQQAS